MALSQKSILRSINKKDTVIHMERQNSMIHAFSPMVHTFSNINKYLIEEEISLLSGLIVLLIPIVPHWFSVAF